jgi:hypothetical protein
MWWWIGGGLIGFVVVLLALVALVDVIRNKAALSRAQFFAWLILVLVLPLVGLILWFTVGRKTAHDQARPVPGDT